MNRRRATNRRAGASIVASPVLVGAVTTLVVVVAVFLAYNANNGLPFVPTRQVKVQLPNGANLVKGNEVRSGGFRIGVVEAMRPVQLRSGTVGAELTLKLDKKIGAVPEDTRVVVRPRSALGLKYVEFEKGRSKRMLADGATLPASQTKVPVEIDEVFNMFDADTRRASQGNLEGFGDAFAARGADLNATIRRAPALLAHLESVMHDLGRPDTELKRFFDELGDAARIVQPVSARQARNFTSMADTFAAFSDDPEALKATISKSPPALDAGIRSLRVQRPFLERTARFSASLNAAASELRAALPDLNSALRAGIPVQKRSPELNEPLADALEALDRLVAEPATNGSLRGLGATVETLQPQLRYLGPLVTVCNDFNYFWTFAAEHMSAPDDTGSSQRALLNTSGEHAPGSDHIGSSGANEFAHGKGEQGETANQQLHGDFYGPAVNDRGEAHCGAGQTGYVDAGNPFRDRSVKGDPYERVVVDRFATTGPLGPTYRRLDREGRGVGLNPARVPEGQTFTSKPGGRGAVLPTLP